jgi:hypothetical protein
MNLTETRDLVTPFLSSYQFIDHQYDKVLRCNGESFRIRPDDMYLFKDRILIVEYENNKRPVESISKYFWLFENTKWLQLNMPIHLMLIITNKIVEEKYKIRTESIKILGDALEAKYSKLFKFIFINNSEINKGKLESDLATLTL